jgi:hypothetical protein
MLYRERCIVQANNDFKEPYLRTKAETEEL